METIVLLDKKFQLGIESEEIQSAVEQIAQKINIDMKSKNVVFVPVLNGAFMFAADLFRKLNFNFSISFVKFASYDGMQSTGKVNQLIGLNEELKNKNVVLIEDIVDSGQTIDTLISLIKAFEPENIQIATLLFKPAEYKFNHTIDYKGFNIKNNFVVGYGLDYNGYGRNLESIYTCID